MSLARNFTQGILLLTQKILGGFYLKPNSVISQSFAKIKPSRNGEIILLFTGVCKSCSSRKFLCILTLLVKIVFSGKFRNFH